MAALPCMGREPLRFGVLAGPGVLLLHSAHGACARLYAAPGEGTQWAHFYG